MVQKDLIAWGAAAAVLALFPTDVLAMYSKSSPVVQVDAKNYQSLIADSNHTSPAYEKAAKKLVGLAKVAAINCDDESNKAFCGSMGVQGFPTLKIVRPGKKRGRPNVEDYTGPRTAKDIVEALVDKIPNHVTRLGDKDLGKWLKESNETAKAVLFTNKGTTSPLFRALAVDFLDGISFAQIRDKEQEAAKMFGVEKFPTLILLPGGDKKGIVYDGEMKKEALVKFLSQVRNPNPDPAPKAAKPSKAAKKDKEKKKEQKVMKEDKSAYESASASHASEEEEPEVTTIVFGEDSKATTSPDSAKEAAEDAAEAPSPKKVLDTPPPIPSLESHLDLRNACLQPKSSACVLVLLPAGFEAELSSSQAVVQAQAVLAKIVHKHAQRKAAIFPFYAVPATNADASAVRTALGLKGDTELEIIVINARRNWFRRFEDGDAADVTSVENWIDAIRLGEGRKEKLPEGLVVTEEEGKESEPVHIEL
ncbi:MAG: hypothetical protein M1823_004545 [Watsoniomyces obsoletus]|nr:MAG: hypothetical protein M1823_004545 [Watsoniomyces obsoletus]